MARQEMSALIAFVRDAIGDPAGVDAQFMDEQIQAHLDQTRIYRANIALDPLNMADGTASLFRSKFRFWADDALTTPVSFDANESNLLAGHFSFATPIASAFISGWTFDPYAVGADLLTIWAGQLESEISKFSADGSSYEFITAGKSKTSFAAFLRSKSDEMKADAGETGDVKTVNLVRDDQ